MENSAARLIDCFTPIMTYISYFNYTLKSSQPEFETIKNEIDLLFSNSETIAKKNGIKHIDWKKGCFPVAAWVDESILCSSWNEKDNWRKNQLQLRYFKTTNAGSIFFDKLKGVDSKELREVFTYCLSLGFKGMYFSRDDFIELSEIKADNLLLYFSEDEDINFPHTLFPEAYEKFESKKKKNNKITNFIFYLFFIFSPPAGVIFAYFLYQERLDSILNKLSILW